MSDLNNLHGTISPYHSAGFGAPTNSNNIKDGNDGTAGSYASAVTGAGEYRGWESDLGALYEVTSIRLKSGDNKNGTADELQWSSDGLSWSGGASGSFGSWDGAGLDQVWTPTSSPIVARYFRYDRLHGGGFGAGLDVSSWELRGADVPVDPPGADFSATPRAAPLGTSIAFTDLSDNTPTSWLWTFGDGHTSTAQDPTHTYAARGSYTVSLTATNAGGSDSITKTNYIAVGVVEPSPPLVGGSSLAFAPNNPCRGFAWYGPRYNRVQVFTGITDRIHESRDPKQMAVKARSRMKWLLEQSFAAIGSQAIDDADAVLTEANGVYYNRSPEYIVEDCLTRAGWPDDERVIAASGIVIPVYILQDKASWAEQIAGSNRLTDVSGFDFFEDPLGFAHFEPNALTETSEPTPGYTFEAGVDVLALDHEADDEDLVTRVQVSGPMTSEIPAWKQEWETTAIPYPVGAAYRASESGYVYIIDRLSRYLYKVRQTDRKVVAKWPLGPSLTNQPIGISIDPTDTTYFYVLDAHLPGSGVYTNCKVRKFRWSDKALISMTTLADGQWSDMKFDGTHLWLTNFGDDKLYEKTFVAGGAAGATASFTYVGKTNPTGMYLNGTTIGLFFNGGSAFYLVSTSAPGTITGTQSTAGTHILGGEVELPGGTHLFAVAEKGDFGSGSGHVWKFQLTEEITTDVVKWAYDQELEDYLGLQSGIADRVHDLHPLDAPHPFEIRPAYFDLQVVNSPEQALAVSEAKLELLRRIRLVLDLATLGHPGLVANDVIRYIDRPSGMDGIWVLDSYRCQLSGDSTFTTAFSALPWEAPG